MNLVIHDLNKEEWVKIAHKYEGWNVVSDDGTIKPCLGCFGCWIKTPGECVVKDKYNKMGELICRADEVVIISRYTFGGFSSFVKNVVDRSIGYILPFFEIVNGEMHHRARYKHAQLKLTVHFYGNHITEEDKAIATKYVEAVCLNLKAHLNAVEFEDRGEPETQKPVLKECTGEKVVLLNCSFRGDTANSRTFLEKIADCVESETEIYNLSQYINKQDELLEILDGADKLVLGMPLYVDGVPSAAVRIMEQLSKRDSSNRKKVYVIANMGFYESRQIGNLLRIMKNWCDKTGYDYCGGLAIGAGEMLGGLIKQMPMDQGPVKTVGEGIRKISHAIQAGDDMEDIYANPFKFPRFLYMFAANSSWPRVAKQNGLKKKDLYRTGR